MKSNYKRLGDYIRQVDVRNRDLAVDNLLGLSISKQFIPSIANTIGTDMANYKIVQPRQFGYVPVTSRNGDKITVALYEGDKPCIISQAYIVFEVSNTSKLLPEYLMMWFRRPEFDRYARFKSHGSAREVFEWEEMCEVMLPVPPIEKQQKIVAEYQTVERRIENNRRLIATLEASAQTIYRKMFVDNIDPNNLPDGWRMGCLTDIANYFNGAACQKYFSDNSDYIPVLKIKELGQGFCDENSDRASLNIPTDYIVRNDDLIFSWSATLLIDYWEGGMAALNQHLFKVSPKDMPDWFVYFSTKSNIDNWKRIISAKATSMSHIKREDLEKAFLPIPSKESIIDGEKVIGSLMKLFCELKRENILLKDVVSFSVSKLSNL